jgi:hypothetical protein
MTIWVFVISCVGFFWSTVFDAGRWRWQKWVSLGWGCLAVVTLILLCLLL